MAGANRLQLNFKLTTTEERTAFLEEYLQHPEFIKRPPTEEELETMSNYLLWGKDPITGLNSKQDGTIELETKHGTWDKDSNIESLDGLMEQPTFNEAALISLTTTPTKTKREVFSRKEALAKCPAYLTDTFTALFRQIDELDLMINYYDLAHNRRKNPPRADLVNHFTEEEQNSLAEKASHWNQYKYLKMRHQLVELRREQYTLRDSYQETILCQEPVLQCAPDSVELDCDVPVLPLGLIDRGGTPGLVFRKWDELIPANYSEKMLGEISQWYWHRKNIEGDQSAKQIVDFRELEHVYEMLQQFSELDDAASRATVESNLPALVNTLIFYVEQAELNEVQKEILDLKLKKIKNADIAKQVNEKWGKTYTANYISTIFRQRIIPKINDAASYHEKLVSNIFFEEEFKTCTCCGRTLLRDADNFTRKARSNDGFASRCKRCEKEARLSK